MFLTKVASKSGHDSPLQALGIGNIDSGEVRLQLSALRRYFSSLSETYFWVTFCTTAQHNLRFEALLFSFFGGTVAFIRWCCFRSTEYLHKI